MFAYAHIDNERPISPGTVEVSYVIYLFFIYVEVSIPNETFVHI